MTLHEIAELVSDYKNRNEGIIAAYEMGAYSYQEIAVFYGLHVTTVGKILRRARALSSGNTDN